MSNQPAIASPPSSIVAYLELFRAPNLFTAIADVTMGYLFVHVSLSPPGVYGCLLASSCFLYLSGMVLNDVYDLEVDRRERPQRPLPSGRIDVSVARRLGFGLLAGGVVLGWLAGYLGAAEGIMAWRSGVLATVLAICIWLYNAVLKSTFAGPLAMGACRALNVLLGMSVSRLLDPGVGQWLGFDAAQLLVAGGIGTFIMGVTIFARGEAGESRRRELTLGMGFIAVGLSLLALFPNYGAFGTGAVRLTMPSMMVWAMLVFLLGFSVIRRCVAAVADPRPARVQVAVKQCILSLIVLDAAVCLAVRSPVWWSVVILALMVPTLALGRRIYST